MPNEHKHTERKWTGGLQNNGGLGLFFIHPASVSGAAWGCAVSLHVIGFFLLTLRHNKDLWFISGQEEGFHIRDFLRVKRLYLRCSTQWARTMWYLLTYSYLLEGFYKELAVVLLRVVRHGCGKIVVEGRTARFLEVPLMRGLSWITNENLWRNLWLIPI